MSIYDVAQTLGTHLALSSAVAQMCHRVAHGELGPEAVASLLETQPDEAFEHALQLVSPLPAAQQQQQQETLLAQIEQASPRSSRSQR